MLGHHEVVVHLGGLFLSALKHAGEIATELLLSAFDLGGAVDSLLSCACELLWVGADALDDDGYVSLSAGEQRGEQVDGLHRCCLRVGRDADSVLQRLARGHGKLVDSHGITSLDV